MTVSHVRRELFVHTNYLSLFRESILYGFFNSNFNGYMFCLVLERLKDYLSFGGDLNAFYLCIYFHRRRSWKYYTKTLQTSGDTILKTRFVIFEILLQVKFYPSVMQFSI